MQQNQVQPKIDRNTLVTISLLLVAIIGKCSLGQVRSLSISESGEVALNAFAIAGLVFTAGRWRRLVVVTLFTTYLCYNVFGWFMGRATCNCFGAYEVQIQWTILIDVLVIFIWVNATNTLGSTCHSLCGVARLALVMAAITLFTKIAIEYTSIEHKIGESMLAIDVGDLLDYDSSSIPVDMLVFTKKGCQACDDFLSHLASANSHEHVIVLEQEFRFGAVNQRVWELRTPDQYQEKRRKQFVFPCKLGIEKNRVVECTQIPERPISVSEKDQLIVVSGQLVGNSSE